ncbi:protein of unknown function [Methylocella tundrae]|uniref:Uncharacterized protein n=1 Tax=Methylocella tundrae TaxID=227605 RepID=A0A4U8Z4K5_METTU|nr:protein of unknown function [Methylocella tundrae]
MQKSGLRYCRQVTLLFSFIKIFPLSLLLFDRDEIRGASLAKTVFRYILLLDISKYGLMIIPQQETIQ